MFDSLEKDIEITEGGRPKTGERLIRYIGAIVLALMVFGGLYLGILALE